MRKSAEAMVREMYMRDFDAWFNAFDGGICAIAGTLSTWSKSQIRRKYSEWKGEQKEVNNGLPESA